MKNLLILLTFCFIVCTKVSQAQQLKIDENTVIKNEKGDRISVKTFMELMNTNNYTITEKTDENGDYVQVVKASKEQKKQMREMMQRAKNPQQDVGSKAPSFSLTDINGNHISSEDSKNKIVVLNFWFTACKPCVEEIPELNALHEKFKNNPEVVFASITFNPKEEVQSFLKEHPIAYPVVSDARSVTKDFKVLGYPNNIVIDRSGNYAFVMSGGFPGIGEHIEEAIEKALN